MATTQISTVRAREVFDSRGRPTVEVEITCGSSRPGRAIVPSGASTGQFEALELRDGDASRLKGFGVRQAVSHVNSDIAHALVGANAADQAAIDTRLRELDGTDDKSRLGANAILGVSLAAAYASAEARQLQPVDRFAEIWATQLEASPLPADDERPASTRGLGNAPTLPLPMVNMISGGLHAGGNLDFQDWLILPVGAESYAQAFEWIVSVYWKIGELLSEAGYEGRLVGDEGGFGPKLESNEQALEFVVRGIEGCGLRPGEDVSIGLDVASSHFYSTDDNSYRLSATGGAKLSADEFIDLLVGWVDRWPIVSIEDGLAEEDWDGWKLLTDRLGDRVQLIGDDLFATNPERLARGIEAGVGNSVLVKLNQIGTLTETLETLRMAIAAGYWPVISARSGETEDATIADLVVATGAGQLKVGSVARSERLAKYNQVLRLAERSEFGYLGGSIFRELTHG